MTYVVMHHNKALSEQSSTFFVLLMIYVVMHQSKAISGQSSEFLCNSEDYGDMH